MQVSDPAMQVVSDTQYLRNINSAARDASQGGWLLPLEESEETVLATGIFEYPVPASFLYIAELRLESANFSGVYLDTGLILPHIWQTTINGAIPVIRLDQEYFTLPTTTQSGTATSSGSTSLTDATFPFVIGALVGAVVLSNGKTMTVTSNTDTVLTGTGGWSGGGNPGSTTYVVTQTVRKVRVIGEKRPTDTYTLGTETVDPGMESFLRERATAYSARFLGRGNSSLSRSYEQLFQDSFAVSKEMFDQQMGIQTQRLAKNQVLRRVAGR